MIRIGTFTGPSARPRRSPLRRVLTLGLPTAWGATAWGATAITYKLACPLAQQNGLGARIASSAVFFVVGTGLVFHVRRTLLRELRRARTVAGVAQSALLRPPPPRVAGLRVAAAQLSADPDAAIGGDLYEAVGTEHGVRVVMGDARGHGLAAVGTAAAVLGSFREVVHDGTDLADVLRRLERALARHLAGRARDGTAGEEFVTVLLLEIGADGELRALNCGHPWPHRITDTGVEPLARTDPLPPLGLLPLPEKLPVEHHGHLLPGEALLLHTDGAEDARDPRGRFFPFHATVTEATAPRPLCPQVILGRILTALLHHTQGVPTDDVALLMLSSDSAARGAGPATSAASQRGATDHDGAALDQVPT
ncbi:PP2C family protein-serine/threonine phosphatase [Streptomyces sp. CRN 30]|uniref:PP2C family protein-serine/threonine phosphatase n=1 Tax=Streptomyces sp. CRN 30 TaxID=3075613 RepID=UPI002A7EE4CD|nr:PP2C family protein-serine/threonine phosphatase [Streptomyces sp. CRN 30]